jgi:hypothetical protein
MKALLVMIVVWLMAAGASADTVQFLPAAGGAGQLPTGDAAVGENCERIPWRPCFDVASSATPISDAVAFVEADDPANTQRHVWVFRREADASYTENVNCQPLTGGTNILGLDAHEKNGFHVGPRIVAQGTGAAFTIAHCSVYGFFIEKGATNASRAIIIPAVALTEKTDVRFNQIAAFDSTRIGNGGRLMEILNTNGTVGIRNNSIAGGCDENGIFDAVLQCDASSALIEIDTGTTVSSAHAVRIWDNNISLTHAGDPTAGASTFDIDSAPSLRLVNNIHSCEGNAAGVAVNCYEVDGSNVSEMTIYDETAAEGGVSQFIKGRFMEITGVSGATAISIGHIEGADLYTVNSIWGSVVPTRYAMGCSNAVSVESTTLDNGVTHHLPIDHGVIIPSVAAATTYDTFLTPAAQAPFNVTAALVGAPGAGTWTINLLRSGVLTGVSCLINAASAPGCVVAPTLVGIPIIPGGRMQWQIVPAGAPGGTELTISMCLAEVPR